jgi:anti-anti-sigma factor
MGEITITFTDLAKPAGAKLAKFVGQLDETNIEDQAKKVYSELDKGAKHLVFDFTGLTYLNSKSIGYLADWQSKVTQGGGKLVIFGAAENIFDILDVVGLTKLIDMHKTLEEAQESL